MHSASTLNPLPFHKGEHCVVSYARIERAPPFLFFPLSSFCGPGRGRSHIAEGAGPRRDSARKESGN